jgi:hypothetical protein
LNCVLNNVNFNSKNFPELVETCQFIGEQTDEKYGLLSNDTGNDHMYYTQNKATHKMTLGSFENAERSYTPIETEPNCIIPVLRRL